MRQEHDDQHELNDIPSAQQAEDISDVAALSARVAEHCLVREHRPVFVYDAKLAKQKSSNAERQAKFREKRAAEGLVTARIPAELAEKLKLNANDFSKLTETVEVTKLVEIQVEVIKEVIKEVNVEKIVEVTAKLKKDELVSIDLGNKIRSLSDFKRKLIEFIINF